MQDYLVFQLYAPLASWGDQAVGQERPSADHPSRSALLGLIAASLGIDRGDDDLHMLLSAHCGFGIKVFSAGLSLRDFHTSQVPPTNKKAKYLYTRRDELSESKLGTSLSFRTYQQDSFSIVALWLNTASDDYQKWSLEQVQQSLLEPQYQLYLGRKACPPALPFNPQVISGASLLEALDAYKLPTELHMLTRIVDRQRYYWEHSDQTGIGGQSDYRVPRYDQPLSRKRWQFASRDEYVKFARGDDNVSEQDRN